MTDFKLLQSTMHHDTILKLKTENISGKNHSWYPTSMVHPTRSKNSTLYNWDARKWSKNDTFHSTVV